VRPVLALSHLKIDIVIDNIDIDVNKLINGVDPIGAALEVQTSIVCNPDRSPRNKSIKDMKNKEDKF
jgi:hypothetical protein